MFQVIITAEAVEVGCEIEVATIEIEGEKITFNDLWEECENNLKYDDRFFAGAMELKIRKVKK